MAGCGQDGESMIFAEYRGKFPEISEHVLARIVREHGSDPEACQKILEGESKKSLYGSSPTPESPISPPEGVIVSTPKTSPGTTAGLSSTMDFIRTNSTGSTGSGHSSGRSTPVNQIPTPWVVPNYHSQMSADHSASPNHFPSSVPSGMIYSPVNGGYFHPLMGTNPLNLSGTTTMPGNQQTSPINKQTSPGEGYSPMNDHTKATFPGFEVPAGGAYQTLPKTGYPSGNSGSFPVRTGTQTLSNQISQASGYPQFTGGAEAMLPGSHFTMPNTQHSQPGEMFQDVIRTVGDNSPYAANANLGQPDTRYHTISGSTPLHAPGIWNPPNVLGSDAAKIETPYFAPKPGFVPVHGQRPALGQLYISTINEPQNSAEISQYPVQSNPTQFKEMYETLPASAPCVPVTGTLPSFPTTGSGFIPINPVRRPVMRKHTSAGSLISDSKVVFSSADPLMVSQQLTANDEYIKACLLQQRKRFFNLQKEYDAKKESLESLIEVISDQDSYLYKQTYLVDPNPTDEQIQQLKKKIDQWNKKVSDLSKNIDRLDNGQDALPSTNPDVTFPPNRFPLTTQSQRPKEITKMDRSISVPDIHESPPQHHTLHSQLSEQTLQYSITPDSSLEGWSLINAHKRPAEQPQLDQNTIPENNDEDKQWNCSKCTFLNHDSLRICEMCGAKRNGSP